MRNIFKKLATRFITFTKGSVEFSRTREVLPTPIREVERPDAEILKTDLLGVPCGASMDPSSPEASQDDGDLGTGDGGQGSSTSDNIGTGTGTGTRIASDSLICPFCASKKFIKRGFRQKKREKVQLLQCLECNRTFTPHLVKGKHYPLATIFDALALYNLGFSLEESCRRCRPSADIEKADLLGVSDGTSSTSGKVGIGADNGTVSKSESISASSLANWLNEFRDRMPFLRMREFAMQKYTPFNMVTSATLVHRQLYKFHFHHAKCELIMQENFHHKTFQPLKEFLEMVPGECPHQYFSAKDESFRASDLSASAKSPITFSKTAMIVRGKRNYATMMAEFVLQSVKDRNRRHEALQKYFLYNDSVTIATEVPVYLTNDDLEHMQTQLGFEIYRPNARPDADIETVVDEGGDKKLGVVAEMSSSLAPARLWRVEDQIDSGLSQNDGDVGQGSSTSDNVGTGTDKGTIATSESIRQLADGLGRGTGTVALPNGSAKGNDNVGTGTGNEKVGGGDDVDKRSAGTGDNGDAMSGGDALNGQGNIGTGMPHLITGHIDFLQIRNGMIHILDYKPKAEKEKPIEQLTLYAMALSRLTGLRLFEFKCAWFDEKDYFEFYPLHVLHKPKKARKRKKVDTQEGTYLVNKEVGKIKSVRPI